MTTDHITALVCTLCGERYDPSELRYTCEHHEGVAGVLEVEYDEDVILDRFSADLDGDIPNQWKYAPFLPVDDECDPVTLGEGGTDLLDAPQLSEHLGVDVLVKDDGRNPTGCLKDRASSVGLTHAKQLGEDTVTCASTGNAAASLAGYAARGGLECRIFVPASAPEEKLVQPQLYGADVLAVDGTYDEAYDLSLAVSDAYGWYNRNAAINPFLIEGKRTVGFELAEQAAVRGVVPDWLVFSMGDGCTIAGAWKGFREFYELDFVDDVPKMLGVQAEGAAAIHDVFHEGESIDEADTLADSISVGRPRNTVKACRALDDSGGTAVTVADDDILDGMRLLGSTEGLYAEPAGAAPVAGVKRAVAEGIIDHGETVVIVSTGMGLKDTAGAARATDGATEISPSVAAVERIY